MIGDALLGLTVLFAFMACAVGMAWLIGSAQ